MDRKKIEKAEIDKEALNKILEPFSRSFLIKQIWDEEPSPGRRSTICVRFKKGNWTHLEIKRISLMLYNVTREFLYFEGVKAEVTLKDIIKAQARRTKYKANKPKGVNLSGRNVGNYSKAKKELNAGS